MEEYCGSFHFRVFFFFFNSARDCLTQCLPLWVPAPIGYYVLSDSLVNGLSFTPL
jgi:hypothetical protein